MAQYIDAGSRPVRVFSDVATESFAAGATVEQPQHMAADLAQPASGSEFTFHIRQERFECLVTRRYGVGFAEQP